MTEPECARVQVFRQGYGWVDRLCPWHQAVVDGIVSDLTKDIETARAELSASLARSCSDCAQGVA